MTAQRSRQWLRFWATGCVCVLLLLGETVGLAEVDVHVDHFCADRHATLQGDLQGLRIQVPEDVLLVHHERTKTCL